MTFQGLISVIWNLLSYITTFQSFDYTWYALADLYNFQYFNFVCEFTKAASLLCDFILLYTYTIYPDIYAYTHIHMNTLSFSTLYTSYTHLHILTTHKHMCKVSYICMCTVNAYIHIKTLYAFA